MCSHSRFCLLVVVVVLVVVDVVVGVVVSNAGSGGILYV